jgi:NADPH-dependent curcumin reductase CurA
MSTTNRRIVLAARPKGEPKDTDFRLEEAEVPAPAAGQVLLRTLYLSLDPYMRGRMNEGPSYAAAVEVGDVMTGATVSEVMSAPRPGGTGVSPVAASGQRGASALSPGDIGAADPGGTGVSPVAASGQRGASELTPGDIVLAQSGWQEYAVADAKTLRRLDPSAAPVSTALGVLGVPGLTAYTGLFNIGQPKPGETLVVGAAAGAVGSVVGQMGRIFGCRVVGVAGSPAKCEFVVKELGFDACVDRRQPAFAENLKAECPKGVDVYFENAGGAVLEAVLPLLNLFARVPVCGLIAHYNQTMPTRGVDRVPMLMLAILTRRLTFRGFIVSDFAAQAPDFARDMGQWVREGRVKYREDVVDGLENAVRAFQGLLRGENFGKLLVRVAARRLP